MFLTKPSINTNTQNDHSATNISAEIWFTFLGYGKQLDT